MTMKERWLLTAQGFAENAEIWGGETRNLQLCILCLFCAEIDPTMPEDFWHAYNILKERAL